MAGPNKFSVYLLLLQRLPNHGKGQGERPVPEMGKPRRAEGHPSAHMCDDQQLQAWAQGGSHCGGKRPVWAIWTF